MKEQNLVDLLRAVAMHTPIAEAAKMIVSAADEIEHLCAGHEELLAALKGLFAQCDPDIKGSPNSCLEIARRAIARAENRI